MQMRISYLIFLGFSLILLLFATTTYLNYRQAEKVNANSEYVALSSTIVQSSNRFQRNLLNMISGLRGFLLTGEDYFLQSYDTAVLENNTILRELATLLPDTAHQRHLLKEIDSLNNRWLAGFGTPLRNARISAERSEKNLLYFQRLYQDKSFLQEERQLNMQLQQRIREFLNLEYSQREVRRAALSVTVQQTKLLSFALTSVSVLIGLSIVSFLAYRISRRILRMVDMANSIAGGNYKVHTEVTRNDELGRLAVSLNHMASILSKNISDLKRKNQELDQFAHIVSHDLKAPLRGIDNVITWIEEDHKEELSPKVAEYVELIKGRIRRGENLIQGLLTYARVGKGNVATETVNVQDLVQEILDNYDLKPGFAVQAAPDLPTLKTDKVLLSQVLSNLIGNAIKYNDKEKGLIRIYHEDRGTEYVFHVADNGPGISKQYHEKIFMIFQTLQERDSFESTGVGLAIVKKILDARNEVIQVHSESGAGSRFSFTWKKQ